MTADPSTSRQPSRRLRWVVAGGVLVSAGAFAVIGLPDGRSGSSATASVGSDLHAVAQNGTRVFVSGHDAAAYSDQPGTWTPISSLSGKDAMSWSFGTSDIIVGGHEGAFRSTDNGATFTPVTGLPVTDVHATGAAGSTAYLASPTGGFYVSQDAGGTWTRVNATGESFMGSLLVDPTNHLHVMAADMLQGVVQTTDGGRSWTVLGGMEGPVGLSWNPANHKQIVVTAPADAGISLDGGTSWIALPVPPGTGAVSFDSNGRLLAAILTGQSATISLSSDLGKSWTVE